MVIGLLHTIVLKKSKWDGATTLKPLMGNLTRVVTVTYPQLQNYYSTNCTISQA